MKTKVFKYIYNKIKEDGALHMALMDPDDINLRDLKYYLDILNNSGTDALMIGGSTVADQENLSNIVIKIKHHIEIPVILFPNNVAGITKYADAIWFLSLFNSINPYFITGAQMLAAPYIRRIGLEALSTAYLVVGEGKAAGFVGQANPIPIDKPELALAYAITAELFGFKFVYLEAGSGAHKPIPSKFITIVKKNLHASLLIVGGGIKDPKSAYQATLAGADIIVTGTVIEKTPSLLKEIVGAVKKGGKDKKCLK